MTHQQQHDHDFIYNQQYEWPYYPMLPLRNRKLLFPDNCGFIVASNLTAVFLGNMFSVADGAEPTGTKQYVTVKEMIEDGWYVD